MTERSCLRMEIAAIEDAIAELRPGDETEAEILLVRIKRLPKPIVSKLVYDVYEAVSEPDQIAD